MGGFGGGGEDDGRHHIVGFVGPVGGSNFAGPWSALVGCHSHNGSNSNNLLY